MSFWALKEDFYKDDTENWSYVLNAFDADECKKIIELGENLELKRALTAGELDDESQKYRKSNVSWIIPAPETEWLFRKMTDLVVVANEKFFGFELMGFGEGFQFTKYEAPDGEYDLHIDKAKHKGIRKLSVVVQLTDPSEYEGGDLEIHLGKIPDTMQRGLGNACFFPSYVMHRVTPVTSGKRYSLVAWLTGPQFK
jgi:PKHD-type hydroxylase